MSLPQDGVNANALAETTTIPTGKKLIFLDPDTNEGGIITLENLTKQILSNLATQTFNLDQGTKTLLAALNELNSKGKNSYVLRTSTNDGNDIKLNTPSRCTIMAIFNTAGGYGATLLITIDPSSRYATTGITSDSRVQLKITLDGGILTISENPWLTATLISTSPLSEIK